MSIQWYPGHMAKAKRKIADSLRLVDVIVELVDSRAPASTRNPDFESLFAAKPWVTVLNKADLADPAATDRWLAWYAGQGLSAMAMNCQRKTNLRPVFDFVNGAVRDKIAAMAQRGAKKTVRAMVAGIPNVGKSTFINLIKGKSSLVAADRPGVTRGSQWVAVSAYLEFLDTPGLLWPKLEDERAAKKLAYLGSVRDDIMDIESLAAGFLGDIASIAPKAAADRYKLNDVSRPGYDLLEQACRGRGWLMPGNRADTARGAAIVLDEFRQGRLGRITLEEPPS